jgi:hypothetical protein
MHKSSKSPHPDKLALFSQYYYSDLIITGEKTCQKQQKSKQAGV